MTPTHEKKPNILIIWGDDIGMWNISAYHRGMMGRSASELACFILKSDAAHQFGETRVATKRIERRFDF
jgi:arylsulfatase A-like enzyme